MNRRGFLKQVGVGAVAVGFGSRVRAAGRPNILFAMADDASYPHMSGYGCTWVNTPAFDRVADGGILFTRAYTSNAKCAPSRACILTGRNTWQLEEACNHAPFFPEFSWGVAPGYDVLRFQRKDAMGNDGTPIGSEGTPWTMTVVGVLVGTVGPPFC